MKLSVIIPAINEAANIRQTIERAWSLDPLDVVIADGGSCDATPDLARALNCTVVPCPRGRAVQQNLGAQHAAGNVLLFLHADSWLEPAGRHQMEHALRSPQTPGGAFRHRFETNHPLMRLIEFGDSLRVCTTRIAFGDQGIFIRRAIFDQIGGFPETRLMEDVLLCRRLRDIGRLVYLPGRLHTSARRHLRHGPIRQTLRNWLLLSSEQFGVPPDRLADFYTLHSRNSTLSPHADCQ